MKQIFFHLLIFVNIFSYFEENQHFFCLKFFFNWIFILIFFAIVLFVFASVFFFIILKFNSEFIKKIAKKNSWRKTQTIHWQLYLFIIYHIHFLYLICINFNEKKTAKMKMSRSDKYIITFSLFFCYFAYVSVYIFLKKICPLFC